MENQNKAQNTNINNDHNNLNTHEPVSPNLNELIIVQDKGGDGDDDDTLAKLHQRLMKARELRKISEKDVKVLNVRVRNLKEENKKALAKINKANKKTNDKLTIMKRIKSQSIEKVEFAKKKENDLAKLKEKNYNKKIERDYNIMNSRKKVISQNKLKGKISKKQKQYIDEIKNLNKLNEKNKKKNRVDELKSQSVMNQKRIMMEIEKQEELIKDLEEKINREKNKQKEWEFDINKMLEDESDIIERINYTSEMQNKICEYFEKNFKDDSNDNSNNENIENDNNNDNDNDNWNDVIKDNNE